MEEQLRDSLRNHRRAAGLGSESGTLGGLALGDGGSPGGAPDAAPSGVPVPIPWTPAEGDTATITDAERMIDHA